MENSRGNRSKIIMHVDSNGYISFKYPEGFSGILADNNIKILFENYNKKNKKLVKL